MVATTDEQREHWTKLIDLGLQLAAQAAVDRLGTQEAVEAEFNRIALKMDEALNGEQSDIAAMVMHASLIATLEKSIEQDRVN